MSISNGKIRYNVNPVSGTFDGLTADSVYGSAVNMRDLVKGTLSALCVVTAQTTSLTITASWQGSADGSTWVDIAHAPQNPAGVALATGTAGADPAVTRAVPAPEAAYGFRFARAKLTNGGAQGTTSDTFTVGYCYARG